MRSIRTRTVSTMIWSTDRTPADISIGETVEDLGARIIGTAPPANGTRFAVIDFPPGNQPRMHRTETIDYVIVLEGEIEMDMDNSTVKMKAGDVMVQRGTNHAWANRSNARPRRLRADRCRAVGHRSPHHRGGQRPLTTQASVPIPKLASLCCTLVCELRNRRTLTTLRFQCGFGSEVRISEAPQE